MDIEGAAENEREAKYVIDLIGIIRATRGNDAIGPDRLRLRRRDFRVGVGHGEDDRLGRHFGKKRSRQSARRREAQKHIGADQRLFEIARRRVDRMGAFPLVHALGAAAIDDARAVADDDVIVAHAQRFDERGAGQRRRPRAIDHDLDVGQRPVGQQTGVDEPCGGDDRGAVLVIMHHRDLHPLAQGLLDHEAFGRLDVLKVDPAKAWLHQRDGFDQRIGIFGIQLDINGIDIGKAFEQDRLALHDGLGGQRAEIAQPQDRCAVRDDRDEVALGGVVVSGGRVVGDGLHRHGNARRIGEAQVALRRHRFGRDDLDLTGPDRVVIKQRFALGKADIALV